MTRSPFVQLLWKEYRAQRALWLAMLGIALLLQVWVLAIVRVPTLGGVLAAFWPALYAMGCGAMLFAAEHDEGTYEFQRGLPVTAWQLLLTKLAFAMASLVAMVALLTAWAFVWGGWPDGERGRSILAVFGVGTLEVLAWTVLASLVSRRVIPAAILGMLLASLSIHACVTITDRAVFLGAFSGEPYVRALPLRGAVLLLVLLADLGLGLRWLRVPTEGQGVGSREREVDDSRRKKIAQWKVRPRGGGLLHLVWQHWRQSWRLLAIVGLGVPVPCLIGALGMGNFTSLVRGDLWVKAVVALTVALLGGCVFAADQRGDRYRFFAEQGVRPSLVWWSRQLVVGGLVLLVVLVGTLVVLTTDLIVAVKGGHGAELTSEVLIRLVCNSLGFALSLTLLAYSVGQFCSMLFRSSVLALVFSLVLGGLAYGWYGLVWRMQQPLYLVWLVALLLLGVTWLRTPDWLLQRNRWAAWCKTGGALALGLAAILALGIYHRIEDIPGGGPGFDVAEFTRPRAPAEEETLRLYQEAWNELLRSKEGIPSPGEFLPGWVAKHQAAIDLALQASQRSEANFYGLSEAINYTGLGSSVLASGQLLQSEGKRQEAAERYLATVRIAWQLRQGTRFYGDIPGEVGAYQALVELAWDKQWSAQELRELLAQAEKVFEETPFPDDATKVECLEQRAAIASDLEFLGLRGAVFSAGRWVIHHFLPWEAVRAERVVDRMATESLQRQRDLEHDLAAGQPVPQELVFRSHQEAWRSLYQSTPLLCGMLWWDVAIEQDLQVQTRRRVVLTCLALAAWRAEHGELPPTLDALVGPYLKRLPLEPGSGKSFGYYPQGIPEEVKVDAAWNGFLRKSDLPRFVRTVVNGESKSVIVQPDANGKLPVEGEVEQYLVPAGTPLLWMEKPLRNSPAPMLSVVLRKAE